MHEIILCKLGEVVLKGLNRRSFEMKLMSNIRRRTQPFGKFKIYSRQSTIYVEPVEDACDIAGAYAACKQVFGIIAITRALPCEKSKEAIFDTAKTYLAGALTAAKSFKVESKRADKTFPMGSIQLSQWVGGALHDAFPHLTVDVHHPELTVYVEVREDAAYVHGPAEAAAGGLPLGMGGHAVSLLSGGIDSPVSSYMIAKRGVQLEMIHFASPPYTSELAREKVLKLAQELTPWCGRLAVFIIPFTEIQEEIRRKCPEDHFTLIMRRFMMRLADMLAQELYTHRKYGVSRVKQELLRRGIDRALAEEAAERLDKDDLNRIILLLQTKYRNNLGDEKGIIRTKNSLLRLGYSYSDIRAAFESIENESF